MFRRMILAGLGLAALSAASTALADAADDAPLVTSDGGPGVYTLDQQIEDWRIAGQKAESPSPFAAESLEQAKRKPHGVVSVGVGSGGYRSAYARTDLPLGETGTLSLAVGQERGRVWGRNFNARSLMLGLDFSKRRQPDCKAALDEKLKAAPWRRMSDLDMREAVQNCDALVADATR